MINGEVEMFYLYYLFTRGTVKSLVKYLRKITIATAYAFVINVFLTFFLLSSAQAACVITGTGTLAFPGAGDLVTCSEGVPHTAQIGNFTPTFDVVMEENASIQLSTSPVAGLFGVTNLSMALGSTIGGNPTLGVIGTNGNDIFDISGSIYGTAVSLLTFGGTDTVILRTGSDIMNTVFGDAAGFETLELYGTNSENVDFSSFDHLIMNGESWAFSGTTSFGTADINSGVLLNNGAMTSDVNVNTGTVFGGVGGVVGNIVNSGTVAPGASGASIGTQTIAGVYTQGAGGNLEIEFDPGGADRLTVFGSVNLDGTVSFTELTSGVTDGTTYTFLTSGGGLTGTFSTINNQLLFIDPVVTYTPTSADVILNRVAYTTASTSSSESAVAGALDSVLASSPSSITSIEQILNNFSAPSDASNFFASQSGMVSGASVSTGAQVLGLNVTPALNRVRATGSDITSLSNIAPAAGGDDKGVKKSRPKSGSFWAQGTSGFGDIESDSKARGSKYKSSGLTIGADTNISENIKIGGFGAFSAATSHTKTGLGDKSETSVYQAGVYGAHKKGTLEMDASLSGAFLGFKTDRPTGTGTAKADFNGYGLFGTAEIRSVPKASKIRVSPFLGLKVTGIRHEGYRESGAGVLNLTVKSKVTRKLSSEIGFVGDAEFLARNFRIKPSLRIGWVHEFLDNTSETNASFSIAPAVAFQSQGPDQNKDFMRIKLDLVASEIQDKDMSLYCSYDGSIASNFNDHMFTAGMRYIW